MSSIEIYKIENNIGINYKLKFMVNENKGRRPIEILSGSYKKDKIIKTNTNE